MKRIHKTWFLIIACFAVSILSHSFFVGEWFKGTFMIGTDDGLSQMVPFREMLYDHYSRGDFFYSYEYGLGGGTFSQLAYYYATNVVFWITCLVVFGLETLQVIKEPDVLFWAGITLFVSITRLSIVIGFATYAFRYIRLPLVPAFTGAVLYGASSMYFRFNVYWEFFSDAFLWLPILFIGIEKVIREAKPGWLITAVAISAFDNFYFAFIHCVFALMYIGLRWFIPLTENETKRLQQLKLFVSGAVLGAGIGAFSFVPAVYGFLNNFRPPYEDPIPLVDLKDNILLDSYLFVLPAIFVLLLFTFRLYKQKTFLVFVTFSLVIVAMHYTPVMWSFFNGFSAPKQRFEYLGSFTIGGAVATGLSMWHMVKRRQVLISSALALLSYGFFFYVDVTYGIADLRQSLIATGSLFTILVWIVLSQKKSTSAVWLICVVVIAVNTATMYQYQEEKLFESGEVLGSNKDYILSEDYYSKEQRKLINEVLAEDDSPLARMEWKTDGRNNTPIIQGFTGTSVYSSVLNKNLLFFYYHDLKIDMKRESVSRYAGFGDRANLHSLFQGRYVMRESGEKKPVPYGFQTYSQTGEYVVYKNSNTLPFVRTSSKIYSEGQLAEAETLAREHAMLDGIIIDGYGSESEAIPEVDNLMEKVDIEEAGAKYENDILTVNEDTGGLDLNIENPAEQGDYYVSFYLNQAKGMTKGFPLHINGFETTRKPADSIYRTKVNQLTIRVEHAETISIRMPEGSYHLEDIKLYHEDYRHLEREASNKEQQANVRIDGSRISIVYENDSDDRYLTIPVPYEKGWQVHVNGNKRKVEKANYAFLGTELEPGKNKIEFVYYPPYFKISLFISLFSLVIAVIWIQMRKKTLKK